MCGLVGFFDSAKATGADALRATIERMTDAIVHRGPDGSGLFCNPNCGLALGHRRLAIVDLTDAGRQPMTSADGRWVIVFNGEIYNYEELREALEREGTAPAWKGHSDTEVLLAAVGAWGLERTLQQANGMFAMAVWDEGRHTLSLARDRMGEKPLYYGWQGRTFLFGSELKALTAHPSFERRLDRAAMARYLEFSYVPAPHSIYAGIRKLAPAHFLTIGADDPVGTLPDETAYWTLPSPHPQPMAQAEALARLDTLLRDSVAIRMRSDVPMGAFLSGGIDSSTVVALMQAQSSQPVRTFSIGFAEAGYDESRQAAAVAAHLKTAHTELRVSPADALDAIPTLGRMYDEPFADSSQIPTYLLSKLTRRHVTVSLSGDGGDELFGGYTRYFTFDAAWNRIRRIPSVLRRPAASVFERVPASVWRRMAFIPQRYRREITEARLRKLCLAMRATDGDAYYRSIMRIWQPSEFMAEAALTERQTFWDRHAVGADDAILAMSFLDQGSYLPDDILVKLDRATMATSLEGRIPLLDHRIVEFAAGLPLSMKVENGVGKKLLREVLARYVPSDLIDRRKQGFAIPLQDWLRGPLRDWADTLISDDTTALASHLDMRKLRTVWQRHLGGQDQNERLWNALMLLAWGREWNPV